MVTYLSNVDGETINPAKTDLQLELINEIKKQESSTNDIKFQVITLAAASEGTPASHGCKKVRYWTALSDCYIGDSDSQPVLLIASIWTELSINNVGNLRFISATGGAVYIISSN